MATRSGLKNSDGIWELQGVFHAETPGDVVKETSQTSGGEP